jgi:DNA-3-methyladenine glycosylase II
VPVIPERPQGLETLVLLILEQQVSIDSAKATLKLREEIKIFDPTVLMDLSDQEFRIGVSRQKHLISKHCHLL